MKKWPISLSLLLPIAQLLLCLGLILVPAIPTYLHLKHLTHGTEPLSLSFGPYAMTIPADRLFRFVLERAALRAEAVITILNAPALFIDALLSIFIPRLSDWMSASLLLTWTRHSIMYPLYAVIAWVYVGRAFDSLLHRREVRTVNAVFSLILVLLVFGSAILLIFGLSTGELEGEGRFYWIISGLALWSVLFSVPFTIWLYQKLKRTHSARQDAI